jgi:hypothetical protein
MKTAQNPERGMRVTPAVPMPRSAGPTKEGSVPVCRCAQRAHQDERDPAREKPERRLPLGVVLYGVDHPITHHLLQYSPILREPDGRVQDTNDRERAAGGRSP